jgi:hypothetical protein
VVCAVICEPVSTTNSRLLGNLIGNSALLDLFRRVRDEILGQGEILMPKFPVQRNRELRRTNREFEASKRVLVRSSHQVFLPKDQSTRERVRSSTGCLDLDKAPIRNPGDMHHGINRGRRRTPRPVARRKRPPRGVDMTAGTIRHMFPFFEAENRFLWVAISALFDKGRECLKIERLRPPNRHRRTPRR